MLALIEAADLAVGLEALQRAAGNAVEQPVAGALEGQRQGRQIGAARWRALGIGQPVGGPVIGVSHRLIDRQPMQRDHLAQFMGVVEGAPRQGQGQGGQEGVGAEQAAPQPVVEQGQEPAQGAGAPQCPTVGDQQEIDVAVGGKIAGRQRAGHRHHPHIGQHGEEAGEAARRRSLRLG